MSRLLDSLLDRGDRPPANRDELELAHQLATESRRPSATRSRERERLPSSRGISRVMEAFSWATLREGDRRWSRLANPNPPVSGWVASERYRGSRPSAIDADVRVQFILKPGDAILERDLEYVPEAVRTQAPARASERRARATRKEAAAA